MDKMRSDPGTYILLLHCPRKASIQIGRWQRIELKIGYYLYVGSAFGPGGVRARVLRHARKGKTLRWHIDYLNGYAQIIEVWFNHTPIHLEHSWARTLDKMDAASPIPRFGSSDCNCPTHLYYYATMPDSRRFSALSGNELDTWVP